MFPKPKKTTKPKKGLKKFSDKRQAKEREYKKLLKEMSEDPEDMYCRGCGTFERLSPSHRISRARNFDLIAEPDNVEWMCMTFGGKEGCHDKVEEGKFDELDNGDEIKEYIQENDPVLYDLLVSKLEKNYFVVDGTFTYTTNILTVQLLNRSDDVLILNTEKGMRVRHGGRLEKLEHKSL